jgi:multiple sugar transport system ATP-binding protein
MATVTLQNIQKKFGEVEIIPNLNLEIKDRELVVLVGPSGCGKTTALRMVAGLESATGGTIHIGTNNVTELRSGLRNCAMVFQNYALYPHMTVAANIGYGMKVRGVPREKITKSVSEAAQIVGLSHLLERRPKHLSGGQRQRVAIARALVREPDVFLFDEPLSNLDAKLRVEMRAEIKKLHRRLQATMIYVTHDQVEAMTLADRVVVMRAGRIEQAADPMTLYETPANMFVAGFIGAPSMNFLEVTSVTEKNYSQLLFADGSSLNLLSPKMKQLESFAEKRLFLGIRPEHIQGQEAAVGSLKMAVDAIELLGSHKLLIGTAAGKPFVAQVPSSFQVEVEQTISLKIDTSKVHIFDGETEKRINLL